MPILETDEEALPKAAIPKSAIPKAAIPKSAIPKSAIPKADLSQAATETPLQLDFRKTERYDRLHSVDRQSAEMLRTYCRVNSRLEETATRLANVSGWQNLVTSVPLLLADWLAVYASLRLAAYVAFWLFGNQLAQKHSNEMLLVSLVVLPLAHLAGLYPGLGLGSILEFRQLLNFAKPEYM